MDLISVPTQSGSYLTLTAVRLFQSEQVLSLHIKTQMELHIKNLLFELIRNLGGKKEEAVLRHS